MDSARAAANLGKHGVSFDVASRVFADPHALMEQDRIEGGEQRWQALGWAGGRMLLLVAHTAWEEEESSTLVEVVRIISARAATRRETTI